MSTTDLPFRATTDEACAWLALQTASPWTLARLLEHGLTPYVWLDYDPAYPELFGDANGGYAAPIFFEGDIARLAAGSDDVLMTMTKDAYKIVARLPEPGFRRPLDQLRFQKKDLERLAGKLKHEAEAAAESAARPAPAASESQYGIGKAEVLAAFARLVRLDLDKALDEAIGIFGDDGARVKASARKSKRNAVWNPVTLALGLHDVYRVPLGPLKRAFASHDFLHAWQDDWEQSLYLLGK
ncbi:hypothetical protein [Pseudoduganella albidiflava]|uniref:Uncharacterized protein n=1 Tax=Pseudoduganella albidiflava TaxID=321983 RepID=A0A411WXF4_9BURK|nr:hypothetical protein [Pseudoduganella albidiflava]QBI01247.1 hypothetical protein EYF70_10650 [Pseudoduganella albidiflava]GGY49335.1 hypothetical protein GCM10007387_34530 [Pseudoduganella albidiflava]